MAHGLLPWKIVRVKCFNGGLIRNHIFWEIEDFEDHQKNGIDWERRKRKSFEGKEIKKNKIEIREKGGHNSEPTQKQNCYCESIKELMKNKKHTYSHNLKIS